MSCSRSATRGKAHRPRPLRSLQKSFTSLWIVRSSRAEAVSRGSIRCIIHPELKRKRCRQPKAPYQIPRKVTHGSDEDQTQKPRRG